MDKLINEQLKKCKVAPLPEWDEHTTHLTIPKLGDKNNNSCVPGRFYLMRLDDSLVHPSQGDAFHANWNNNIIPRYGAFRFECLRILGKMVEAEGVACDPDTGESLNYIWKGWLPLDKVEIIKDITG